jgi:anti-sigma B factor antagonist
MVILMNINERTLNDVTILDIDGNLAREENAQFRTRVAAAINAGARKLVLNLASVSHMDSSGLGELISCYTSMQKLGGSIKLLSPNHRLQNLLVITKLNTLFNTFDSESAAIASFARLSGVESRLASAAQ